ncbi:zinc finger CCCH domain-containing protein 44-like isoform X4 [Phaseolus vulgaris]|uniref:zinc finger CCCH domain-containing protein 44-like isoform X4 n=1 Tax=Phaseolus vulgaris TaxID=3885 RepID=UPI0035C9801D
MVKKNKIRKEDIAEDWCFVCKDGGLLMVCDHRDCRKSYHPRCVEKDDSFLENGSEWTCSSHFCFLCHKASKFRCFYCPKAICGKCFYDAEFAIVKGNKGFCSHCLKLALLIENDADIDSEGELVDFKDQDTYEFLFSEYYKFIKEGEGLNSEHVHSAHGFFKNGKSKHDLDPDEIGLGEDGSDDSEDVSNYIVSDCDDLNDTAGSMSGRTKKGLGKLKSMKGNGKDKKKEFIGWGSRSLMEFLEYIGKDTSNEFSEHDVTSIIIEYCRENNLFDPKKKRKIHCDAPLRSLLRRKSVNRNSMQNLLSQHFAENFEEMGDISSSSEDREYSEPSNLSRKRKSISCSKSHNLNTVREEHQSCFAAIVSSNLKLVYLKRSLVDELSKQPQTFDDKVLGSYVRIKTDPYDYLQKNSHLLVQVVGINRSLRTDEINKEIMLQLSHVPKNVPISKISDDDFSEEECQDLYQRMKNGLLKQPTVLELEQKARSLHEDIMKHWIPRKLVLLQNCIDHANEKGWRRELAEYIDQKLKLETQLEQSRLLNDIPKVIPEIVDTTLSAEGSPRIDKLEQNGLSELASGQTCNSVGHYSKHSGFSHSLNKRTDIAVERIAQDVENDKGVPTIDSSKPRVDKSQSNKVLHVYTRRNLQQKKVQPIIPTLEQMDSIISPYNVPVEISGGPKRYT